MRWRTALPPILKLIGVSHRTTACGLKRQVLNVLTALPDIYRANGTVLVIYVHTKRISWYVLRPIQLCRNHLSTVAPHPFKK